MAFRGRTAEVETVEAERFGDLALYESLERLSRHSPHDFAHQPAIGESVVSVLRTRLIRWRGPGQGVDHRVPVEHLVARSMIERIRCKPAECVSRWATVTRPLPRRRTRAKYSATGAS